MRNIKKILCFTLLISMLLLISCSSKNSSNSATNNLSNSENSQNISSSLTNDDESFARETYGYEQELLDKIIENGEITIAMEGTWSPWTYHEDENNVLVGYDVEIGEEIAKRLGVNANFVEGEWDGLLAGLSADRYDIMINGVDITDERKEAYDFTKPYAYIKTAIIVNEDNDSIKSFEDLKGKKTANTITSTYAEIAEKYGASVSGVDDLYQTIDLLLQNRIDATLNSEVTFYDYKNTHPGEDIKIAALSKNANEIGIPIRKGNKSLLDKLNSILDDMREDGTLAKLSNKYFN